jgi:aspartyl-tRNA(Asn)/glutamyl-tRNA(Gln) amidotransferase subunit A
MSNDLPYHSLTNLAAHLARGDLTSVDLVQACLDRIARLDPHLHAFIDVWADSALACAEAADLEREAGMARGALHGLPIALKDLIHVAGRQTTAGSKSWLGRISGDTATVAERLRAAGMIPLGKTHMVEFAFGGWGRNQPMGTPWNPWDTAVHRVPGGSSSGSAVAVAGGLAPAAIGSDTGGSIRIPAALQGLVGFKSTARLVPTEGAIPLSTTLDTVCAITRSVRDAVLLHEILSARQVSLDPRPLPFWRLAVPSTVMLDALEPAVAGAFERALATLRAAGARIEDITLPELADSAPLQRGGGISAAESWGWHRRRLAAHGALYDPRVAQRIRRGEAISAADYIDLLDGRRAWIARVEAALAGYDALLSPTVPIVAPRIQPLIDSDDAFFAANALLLRNPSLVNLLDGCALSLPCHRAGEWPVGMMVWAPAMTDLRVLGVSLAVERALRGGG